MESLRAGDTVDRYRLIAPLGEGGQGSVWRAEDPLRPGAPVALKLISILVVQGAAIDRLRREARVLARLTHPSLPRCHAFFEDLHKDVLGFALDLVEGESLAKLAGSKDLSPAHRTWILRHLADALGYIHDAGLVHRDIKPQNVMIARSFLDRPEDPAGVKLVDFGIAAAQSNPSPLTQTGSVIGTIEFLAPELLDPGFFREPSGGPERDVYAFGVLAFQLCEGRHPTGLPEGATMGDFIVAYRDRAAKEAAWPPGTFDRDRAALYRACLALRSSKRARSGADVRALLDAPAGGDGATIRTGPPAGVAIENARTELAMPMAPQVPPPVPSMRPRTSTRFIAIVAGLSLLGFALSFAATYFRDGTIEPPALAAAGPLTTRAPLSMEEPPPDPAQTPAPLPPPSATTRATAPSPAIAPAAPPSCPPDMIGVAGPPAHRFCIDKAEVTVRAYCGGGPCDNAKKAFWPGASAAAIEEQNANCTANRPDMLDRPLTCVSYADAAQHCASKGKRLPTMDEWALAAPAIAMCQDGARACPLFEWSSDAAPIPGEYRQTRGPSWRHGGLSKGRNPEGAKNDDLGFRCASDPPR